MPEPVCDPKAPKKAVNVSINSDLLRQAREIKINLSKTLEETARAAPARGARAPLAGGESGGDRGAQSLRRGAWDLQRHPTLALMAQFDVHRSPAARHHDEDFPYLLDVQSDLLELI